MATKTATPASDPPPPAAKPAPSSPRKPTKSSSNLLFLIFPVIIAVLGGLYATVPTNDVAVTTTASANASAPVGDSLAADHARAEQIAGEIDLKYPPLHDKYNSELVHIAPLRLLPRAIAGHKCPQFEIVGDLTSVEDAMALPVDELRADKRVFLMLNGENEGVYVRWEPVTECLRELAISAAEQLGADVDVFRNGVKLMTQLGHPITTPSQLDATRIAHVLLDFQLWVWPGIKVGHTFDVDGVTVKTLSMKPRVFGVEGFFSEDEAQEIMLQGINRLERSPVDSPDAVDGYHSDRTSFTAFLKDNQFTRDFRARTAKLTRLPSASFVERLQLVRYETGQFFRKHEDYFDSKKFVPRDQIAHQEYEDWCTWAAATIRELVAKGVQLPPQFLPDGGDMFPDYNDKLKFQHGLLIAFLEDADATDFFTEHADVEWGTWIRDNVQNRANDIVSPLLKDKGYMLRFMLDAWEKRVGNVPELRYTIPKQPLSAVTHYFRWVRWLKQRVAELMDENVEFVPPQFRPSGKHYPTFNIRFQNILIEYVLKDHSAEFLENEFGKEWATWLLENKDSKDVLWEGLKVTKRIFELVVDAFVQRAGEKFAYEIPEHLQHFEPNRFVTVFLYLNECPEGGETVFPYSKERLVTGIQREGMQECSEGLAVPPTKLTAAMFYAQTPQNFPDPASLHGGCPPARGIKYGANSFAWNSDADEGANAWDLGADLKSDPGAED